MPHFSKHKGEYANKTFISQALGTHCLFSQNMLYLCIARWDFSFVLLYGKHLHSFTQTCSLAISVAGQERKSSNPCMCYLFLFSCLELKKLILFKCFFSLFSIFLDVFFFFLFCIEFCLSVFQLWVLCYIWVRLWPICINI